MIDAIEVAAALFRAIEAKDPSAVAELYVDDVEVLHNFSRATQDKATNLAVLAGLCNAVPRIRYDVEERLLLPDGRGGVPQAR